MKVDFQAVLIGFDGEPLREMGEDITLGKVCCNALGQPAPDETGLTGDEKAKRFTMAVAIFASKEPLDMKVEDVALLKTIIGKLFGPMIVGPCYLLLEG